MEDLPISGCVVKLTLKPRSQSYLINKSYKNLQITQKKDGMILPWQLFHLKYVVRNSPEKEKKIINNNERLEQKFIKQRVNVIKSIRLSLNLA